MDFARTTKNFISSYIPIDTDTGTIDKLVSIFEKSENIRCKDIFKSICPGLRRVFEWFDAWEDKLDVYEYIFNTYSYFVINIEILRCINNKIQGLDFKKDRETIVTIIDKIYREHIDNFINSDMASDADFQENIKYYKEAAINIIDEWPIEVPDKLREKLIFDSLTMINESGYGSGDIAGLKDVLKNIYCENLSCSTQNKFKLIYSGKLNPAKVATIVQKTSYIYKDISGINILEKGYFGFCRSIVDETYLSHMSKFNEVIKSVSINLMDVKYITDLRRRFFPRYVAASYDYESSPYIKVNNMYKNKIEKFIMRKTKEYSAMIKDYVSEELLQDVTDELRFVAGADFINGILPPKVESICKKLETDLTVLKLDGITKFEEKPQVGNTTPATYSTDRVTFSKTYDYDFEDINIWGNNNTFFPKNVVNEDDLKKEAEETLEHENKKKEADIEREKLGLYEYGTCGIMNIGNTCFLNSAIQCLMAIPGFSQLFHNDDRNNILNLTLEYLEKHSKEDRDKIRLESGYEIKEFIEKNKLSTELLRIIKTSHTNKRQTITPTKFKAILETVNSIYVGADQHDICELLGFLVNRLHQENRYITDIDGTLSTVKKCKLLPITASEEEYWTIFEDENNKGTTNYVEIRREHFSKLIEIGYKKYINRIIEREGSSTFNDTFNGTMIVFIECLECNNITFQFDNFNILQLDIQHQEPGCHKMVNNRWTYVCPEMSDPVTRNIDDCLNIFIKRDVLDGDCCYNCSICKKECAAAKTVRIYKLPRNLIIQFNRFYFNEKLTMLAKKYNHITFPTNDLDLTKIMYDDKVIQPNYDLVSIGCHSGSLSGGHYITKAKNPFNGKWYSFNDDSVDYIPDKELEVNKATDACVLFYTRREDPISSNVAEEYSSIEDPVFEYPVIEKPVFKETHISTPSCIEYPAHEDDFRYQVIEYPVLTEPVYKHEVAKEPTIIEPDTYYSSIDISGEYLDNEHFF